MVAGYTSFQDKLENQTNGMPPGQVYVVQILSVKFGAFSPQRQLKVQAFSNIQMLVLNDCGLYSLENFPRLYNLIRFDAVFNQLKDDSIQYLNTSKRLQCLMMGANQIKNVESLAALADHKQLIQIDLLNNPIQKTDSMRDKVYRILPQLKVLDTLDSSGNDAFFSVSMADSAKFYEAHRFQPPGAVGGGLFGLPANPAPIAGGLFGNPFGAVPLNPIPARIAIPIPKPALKLKNKKQQKKLKDGLARTKSYDSMKGQPIVHKAGPMPDKILIKGKGGKLKKESRISQAKKAGLFFPVCRITKKLKKQLPKCRVRKMAGVYISAVMEYMAYELIDTAAQATRKDKKVRITEHVVNKALKQDPLLI